MIEIEPQNDWERQIFATSYLSDEQKKLIYASRQRLARLEKQKAKFMADIDAKLKMLAEENSRRNG